MNCRAARKADVASCLQLIEAAQRAFPVRFVGAEFDFDSLKPEPHFEWPKGARLVTRGELYGMFACCVVVGICAGILLAPLLAGL